MIKIYTIWKSVNKNLEVLYKVLSRILSRNKAKVLNKFLELELPNSKSKKFWVQI